MAEVTLKNLNKKYGDVIAVQNMNLKIPHNEFLVLVGPSGCGKSTLVKTIVQIEKASSGSIFYNGADITKLSKSKLNHYRKDVQLIFQDPDSSLNPKKTIGSLIMEPMIVHEIDKKDKSYKTLCINLLKDVGLKKSDFYKYPHELSGGQKQRVGIARAISVGPKVLICDESVSALDVSVQAQILNLLVDLKNEFNLSYLFIAHDLSVVKYISDKIIVMYLGKILEIASSSDIYESPQHPYTEALLAAVSKNEAGSKRDILLKGNIPDPSNPPSGCVLHPRCSYAKDECMKITPELIPITGKPNAFSACHFTNNLNLKSFI